MDKTQKATLWLQEQKKLYRSSNITPMQTGTLEEIQRVSALGCLFHGGSKDQTLWKLKPIRSRLSTVPVLFAAPAWAALAFIVKWDDKQVNQGTIDGKPYLTINDPNIVEQFMQGGLLYQLSPMTFFHTPRLTGYEYVSKKEVKPISSVFIEDPLALISALGCSVMIRK